MLKLVGTVSGTGAGHFRPQNIVVGTSADHEITGLLFRSGWAIPAFGYRRKGPFGGALGLFSLSLQ
jgi:hypothetical protein